MINSDSSKSYDSQIVPHPTEYWVIEPVTMDIHITLSGMHWDYLSIPIPKNHSFKQILQELANDLPNFTIFSHVHVQYQEWS